MNINIMILFVLQSLTLLKLYKFSEILLFTVLMFVITCLIFRGVHDISKTNSHTLSPKYAIFISDVCVSVCECVKGLNFSVLLLYFKTLMSK